MSFRGDNTAEVKRDSSDASSNASSPAPLPRSRLVHHLRRLGLPILLGQILSAVIAVTGIASNYLVTFGVSIPLLQNLPLYVLLATIYGFFSWRNLISPKSKERAQINIYDSLTSTFSEIEIIGEEETQDRLCARLWRYAKMQGWHYFIAGAIDVHANWAIVSAYNYTNLTSIQLLDCLTIPTAMLLSRFCLKVHYRWIHVLGVLMCLGGAGTMVGADYLAASSSLGSTNGSSTTPSTISTVLLGDFLVILGAVGYGISNVYQEYLVRRFGILDYLGFASLSATAWTLVWALSLEYNTVVELIARPDQVIFSLE